MFKNFVSNLVWSSTDPDKVSATITGAIIAASSAVILLAGHFGISLTPADVTSEAGQVGLAVGSLWTAFGLIRKIIIWVESKINPVS